MSMPPEIMTNVSPSPMSKKSDVLVMIFWNEIAREEALAREAEDDNQEDEHDQDGLRPCRPARKALCGQDDVGRPRSDGWPDRGPVDRPSGPVVIARDSSVMTPPPRSPSPSCPPPRAGLRTTSPP